ncbi:MAG: ATP-binding protein [Magnetococcales bacterium]|nr:ATP-binding protein [Magnetococcales bacterium]
MLISFSVENWMSFRDLTSFSMVGGRELQHKERVPRIKKYQTKILPIAALYGGNASGKTNFFEAIDFAKWLIVKGPKTDKSPIPVEIFKLDPLAIERPSSFIFEILINEIIYEYRFSVNRKKIIEEKLVRITSSNEWVLFDRQNQNIEFHKTIKKNKFLAFAFYGTDENQLFLNNSVSQKVPNFRNIYDWFEDTLTLIRPDSKFQGLDQFFNDNHPLNLSMKTILPHLDTGITGIGGETIPLETIKMTPEQKLELEEDLPEKGGILLYTTGQERFFVSRQDGEVIVTRMVTFHTDINGKDIKFDLSQESDGSVQVMELLPAIIDLVQPDSKKVYIIDEIDRSLHTLLTRELIEGFLMSCSNNSRSQLLFTTHDVLLMDQHLFRRDEMWVAERDTNGATKLFSFSDFSDIRNDKDIRRSYLSGRIGGIPRLLLSGALTTKIDDKKAEG